ncbi:MAG: hypothetical protein V2B15_11215 [Bacteroidota bacterium]
MKRDPQISKLIRENGVVPAPEGFTSRVMDLLAAEPERKVYKPLIGRGGRIMIILIVIAIVVLSMVYSEPGGRYVESLGISGLDWHIPQFNWNFSFLSEIRISTGVLAAIVAIFILVLSDAGISRRKFIL